MGGGRFRWRGGGGGWGWVRRAGGMRCCSRRRPILGIRCCSPAWSVAGGGQWRGRGGCVVSGGVVHVPGPDVVTDPAAVAGLVARCGIDYLKVTPSHLAALGAAGGLGALVPRRVLVLGGEAAAPGWGAELVAGAGGRG